jgi:hypothetical protein
MGGNDDSLKLLSLGFKRNVQFITSISSMNVFHTELHKSHVQVVKVCSDKVTRGEDVF